MCCKVVATRSSPLVPVGCGGDMPSRLDGQLAWGGAVWTDGLESGWTGRTQRAKWGGGNTGSESVATKMDGTVFFPSDTLRINDVVIASKRRHFDVITSKWRRFDVITTSLLRHVLCGSSADNVPPLHPHNSPVSFHSIKMSSYVAAP